MSGARTSGLLALPPTCACRRTSLRYLTTSRAGKRIHHRTPEPRPVRMREVANTEPPARGQARRPEGARGHEVLAGGWPYAVMGGRNDRAPLRCLRNTRQSPVIGTTHARSVRLRLALRANRDGELSGGVSPWTKSTVSTYPSLPPTVKARPSFIDGGAPCALNVTTRGAHDMTPERHRKPAGGYILIQAGQLLSAWEAHRTKIIRLVDLRVWLACHELVARRQSVPKGCRVNYQLAELGLLVGVPSVRTLRSSLQRLERAELVQWSDAAITFPDRPARAESDSTPWSRRLVPMPRRVGRFLAVGTTRAMTATMLGLLVRCVFYRRGLCTSVGTCKASWVAETFGVNERSVKRARAKLVALGWLESVAAAQWRLNRWGGVYRVNLGWDGGSRPRSRLSPPARRTAPRLSPPDSDKQPLWEYIHQNPASRGSAGFRNGPRASSGPTLRRVELEDLRQTTSLLSLHAEACARGLARPSEAGRLQFVALAERARRCATRSPGGLFVWLLRCGKWEYPTQADEDAARAALREWQHGQFGASACRKASGRELTSVPTPVHALCGEWLRRLSGTGGEGSGHALCESRSPPGVGGHCFECKANPFVRARSPGYRDRTGRGSGGTTLPGGLLTHIGTRPYTPTTGGSARNCRQRSK